MKIPINKILEAYNSVSLKQLDRVSLMKRVDTKFLLSQKDLGSLLHDISSDYYVLEIEGEKIQKYASVYFDTSQLDFYHNHHNDRVNRIKVRCRKYINTDLHFLEIKIKNSKGYTDKKRIPVDRLVRNIHKQKAFIHDVTGENYKLESVLTNSFNRITLVDKKFTERVTIDLNLCYESESNKSDVEGLIVVELKQSKFDRMSKIVSTLKEYKSYPYSFSKYCIGMLLTNDNLKHNTFKEKILKLNKLTDYGHRYLGNSII